jgi:hypothetical protein
MMVPFVWVAPGRSNTWSGEIFDFWNANKPRVRFAPTLIQTFGDFFGFFAFHQSDEDTGRSPASVASTLVARKLLLETIDFFGASGRIVLRD